MLADGLCCLALILKTYGKDTVPVDGVVLWSTHFETGVLAFCWKSLASFHSASLENMKCGVLLIICYSVFFICIKGGSLIP